MGIATGRLCGGRGLLDDRLDLRCIDREQHEPLRARLDAVEERGPRGIASKRFAYGGAELHRQRRLEAHERHRRIALLATYLEAVRGVRIHHDAVALVDVA